MAQINAAPRRFETSGELHIIDGATDHEIMCLQEGGISYVIGMQEVHEYNDRENIANPLLGKKRPSEFSCTAKLAQYDTSSLITILGTQIKGTPDAECKRFTVEVHYADYQAATAGDKIALADSWVVPGSVRVQHGADFDTISWDMKSKTHLPAFASY